MNTEIHNHNMIIQKICKDKYKIYQSFLFYYSLNEYLTINNKILKEKEILKVFQELYDLQMSDDEKNKILVKKILLLEEQNFDYFNCYHMTIDFISYDKINDKSIKHETDTFLEKINSESIKLHNRYENRYIRDNSDEKYDKKIKFSYAVFIGLLLLFI